MGIVSSLRRVKIPSPQQVINIPSGMKTISKNQQLNHINIRYFDRFFKKFIVLSGTKEHKTSIPIVYFESPKPLAVIIFDDTEYLDEEGRVWIDVCEDYPFSMNYNTELIQFLNQQYYNDFIENKVAEKKPDEEGYQSYLIPVMLNRIPREIIRIDTQQQMALVDQKYVNHKSEITQYIIRQIGRIILLERVGKQDRSDLLTGVFLGGLIGIIVGIFISFAFLVN